MTETEINDLEIWPQEISGEDLASRVEKLHTRFADFKASGLYFDLISFGRYELKSIPLEGIKRGRFTIHQPLIDRYLTLFTASPPIVYDERYNLPLDGNHRVEVAVLKKETVILGYVGDPSTYEFVPWSSSSDIEWLD